MGGMDFTEYRTWKLHKVLNFFLQTVLKVPSCIHMQGARLELRTSPLYHNLAEQTGIFSSIGGGYINYNLTWKLHKVQKFFLLTVLMVPSCIYMQGARYEPRTTP